MLTTQHFRYAALVTLTLTGCGGRNRPQAALAPEENATLRVENDNITDMRIYARPGGGEARFPIGTALGAEVTILKIPKSMVTGVTDITFEIRPLAGGRSAFSQRITVSPGEEIVLRIPPI